MTCNEISDPTATLNNIKINPPSHEVNINWLPSFEKSPSLFRLVQAAHYAVGDKHITERINRNDYQLILTVSGEANVEYNGNEYVLTSGSVLLVDCRKHHRYSVSKGKQWEYKHIHFTTDYPQTLLYAVPVFQEDCTKAFDYFDKLSKFSLSNKANSSIAHIVYSNLINNILTSIIIENYHNSIITPPRPDSESTFSDVIEYIHAHYHEPLQIIDLLTHFGYSESYFIRMFKNHYNCTPHQYIMRYRISKVYEHLVRGETVQFAAIACGFGSTSSFYYAVKKHKDKLPQLPQK